MPVQVLTFKVTFNRPIIVVFPPCDLKGVNTTFRRLSDRVPHVLNPAPYRVSDRVSYRVSTVCPNAWPSVCMYCVR